MHQSTGEKESSARKLCTFCAVCCAFESLISIIILFVMTLLQNGEYDYLNYNDNDVSDDNALIYILIALFTYVFFFVISVIYLVVYRIQKKKLQSNNEVQYSQLSKQFENQATDSHKNIMHMVKEEKPYMLKKEFNQNELNESEKALLIDKERLLLEGQVGDVYKPPSISQQSDTNKEKHKRSGIELGSVLSQESGTSEVEQSSQKSKSKEELEKRRLKEIEEENERKRLQAINQQQQKQEEAKKESNLVLNESLEDQSLGKLIAQESKENKEQGLKGESDEEDT